MYQLMTMVAKAFGAKGATAEPQVSDFLLSVKRDSDKVPDTRPAKPAKTREQAAEEAMAVFADWIALAQQAAPTAKLPVS